jgi:hypothetical protein
MVAIGLASGLAFYPEAELEAISRVVPVIGLAGVGLMIAAMVSGAPWLVGWATVTLLTEYGLSLVTRPTIDPRTPLYAAVLFLTVESAYASLERRARIAGLSGRLAGEVARWAAFGVSAFAVAAVVLALASLPLAHGILVQVAGVGAAAAVLATLIFLVRQRA